MSREKLLLEQVGEVRRISGPLVEVEGISGVQMGEVLRIGGEELFGEVVALTGDVAVAQVYEETEGLNIAEPVTRTGSLLQVELGPGLLGGIFDGIQRPLPIVLDKSGIFISRGLTVDAISKEKTWAFRPVAEVGQKVVAGDILGEVQETETTTHRIMVPPSIDHGRLEDVVAEGEYSIDETVARVTSDGEEKELKLSQRWPVRIPRPFKRRLTSVEPLVTGQRIIDIFFPVTKGGTASIPGGFGTGKTVMLQTIAKWSDTQIIVYVGCGERGNEMAEVLEEFPKLTDPYTGRPLMERMMLVANVSNMPIAAREASVYTGITMAEYYRDMGYDVALMADSTSRWAEALREISGRLEEMPGEEGYPAYLATRVASFYERAGKVQVLGRPEREASVSVIGAVSPPGGDFSEPVTQNTLRVVKVFWALDTELAYRRHFPAINWLTSYSLYAEEVEGWFREKVTVEWGRLREKALDILQREDELKEIVRLVGPEALSPTQRLLLTIARSLREDFLMQNALHPVDTFSSLEKTFQMVRVILALYDRLGELLRSGTPYSKLEEHPLFDKIARFRYTRDEDVVKEIERTVGEIQELRVE